MRPAPETSRRSASRPRSSICRTRCASSRRSNATTSASSCCSARTWSSLALSRLNGIRLQQQTGEWNRIGDTPRLDPVPISIETFDEALRYRETKEEQFKIFVRNYLEALSLPRITMFYEDLLQRPDWFFAKIQDFIGITPAEMSSQVRKNTSDDLRTAIPNFEELREHYRDTRYGPMFDE